MKKKKKKKEYAFMIEEVFDATHHCDGLLRLGIIDAIRLTHVSSSAQLRGASRSCDDEGEDTFWSPRPCSALTLPLFSEVHSYTNGSILSRYSSYMCRLRVRLRVTPDVQGALYSGAEKLRCKLPSPKCP